MAESDITELEARLTAARAAPDDVSTLVTALNELGWALRLSDLARAHGFASEARGLAIDSGDRSGQARAARIMAMTSAGTDIRRAFESTEEAHRLYEELDDRAGIAAALDFLSTLYEFIGDLPTSLDHALRALAIAREIGDRTRQGYALSSIGAILGATGEPDQAFDRLQEALSIFQELGDKRGEGRIYSRLCTLARESGLTEEAVGYAERALGTAENMANAFAKAGALTTLAEIESERGNGPAAEKLLRSALAAYPYGSRGGFGIAAQVKLGQLLAARGAITEAETELRAALDRSIQQGVDTADRANVHEALASLSERKGDLEAALINLRETMRLREEASRSEAKSQLRNVEVRAEMEAAKKDAEIHRLKYVELKEMQSRLVEAERGALVGRLAAGTAHELNTPLGVLRSNLDLHAKVAERMSAVSPGDPEFTSNAEKMVAALDSCRATSEAACDRIGSLAQALSRFTMLDQADRSDFDVVEGVDSAMTLIEPTLSTDVSLERRLKPVPLISAWPRDLNQAFMTVLVNATEAIDGEGVVTVSTDVKDERVCVSIADTGRGMDAEMVANLFDVGFSDGGGRVRLRTGLSAAQATVLRHGGSLDVESRPGEGTTLTFWLPASR